MYRYFNYRIVKLYVPACTWYVGISQCIFRSNQCRTPYPAVGHPAATARCFQRAGLGGPAEAVLHGLDVAETVHVPWSLPRARVVHPRLRPGRNPVGRVHGPSTRWQSQPVEQQDRRCAEPDRVPKKSHTALPVQRQPRAGQPTAGHVFRARFRCLRRIHRGR